MPNRVPSGYTYRDKKRGGWVSELDWKDRGIRRRWRGVTKAEAKAQLDRYRRELGDGLKPEDTTFNELADIHLAAQARRLKPATVAQATWAIGKARPHIGHTLVADLTPSDIEKVMHAAEDAGLGSRSRTAIRKQIRGVLQRAVADRMVAANVADLVKGPKTPTKRLVLPPLSKVNALLDVMKAEGHPSWPLVWIIATTGLRTGEARSLRWKDVDTKAGTIKVEGQLDRDGNWSEPKTEAGVRSVPITPRAKTALAEARRRHDGYGFSTTYVFTNKDGKVPAPWTAHKAWTRLQEKHWGKVRLTVHQLRHLYLSTLISAGLPLADAAKVAGHADSRILSEVYAHALDDHDKRVRDALREAGVG